MDAKDNLPEADLDKVRAALSEHNAEVQEFMRGMTLIAQGLKILVAIMGKQGVIDALRETADRLEAEPTSSSNPPPESAPSA